MNKSLTVILSVIIIALGGCSIQINTTSSATVETDSSVVSIESSQESGSSESSEDTSATASESSAEISTSSESLSYESQIWRFLSNPSKWRKNTPSKYASSKNEVMFTDLDGDDYVEMFVARLDDSGIVTTFELYEYAPASPDGYESVIDYTDDVDCADIITDRLDVYYNDTSVLYAANDISRGTGLVEYRNKYFMTYSHNHIQFELLAYARTTTDEGGEFTDYFDSQNMPIPEQDFSRSFDISASSRGDLKRTSVNLSWFPAEDIETADAFQLAQSVAVRPQ